MFQITDRPRWLANPARQTRRARRAGQARRARRALAPSAGVVLLLAAMVAAAGSVVLAEETGLPREAEVAGVSLEAPFNGCLLVFSAPSQSAPKLGFVANGDTVMIHEVQGFFARITCGKFPDGGWAWASYLRFKEDDPATGGSGEPVLLKALRETHDPFDNRDPQRVKPYLPQADPKVVASFMREVQWPNPAP
ncbi:MAG: SH3 domain-containing protein [Candidatus Riflebacteria bacterium]|nr:SH3 domain-containing protein [Candidatus Riflebacteria bacterium]